MALPGAMKKIRIEKPWKKVWELTFKFSISRKTPLLPPWEKLPSSSLSCRGARDGRGIDPLVSHLVLRTEGIDVHFFCLWWRRGRRWGSVCSRHAAKLRSEQQRGSCKGAGLCLPQAQMQMSDVCRNRDGGPARHFPRNYTRFADDARAPRCGGTLCAEGRKAARGKGPRGSTRRRVATSEETC
jgi:hypothetical protein